MADYLGYPFDPELFMYNWHNQPDPTRTALLDSGAMIEDASIANAISNGSDLYTVPFYKPLGGTPANYDGATDVPVVASEGMGASGIVYGVMQGWSEAQFVRDFNSGADPMGSQVIPGVARFYQKHTQKVILGILGAVCGVTEMKSHVIATAAAIDATTLGDAAVDAMGDQAGTISLAFMHSKIANSLAKKELLEYAKYTDANGIQRQVRNLAYANGMTVIVDDSAPMVAGASAAENTYTTYLLGGGVLRHAMAGVEVPVEVKRDPIHNGGENVLITRRRETIHPNGFSFSKPSSGYKQSPTLAQLSSKTNWKLVFDPKSVPLVAVTTKA
nr:major capsid protein [uncultured Olsenella sp.]